MPTAMPASGGLQPQGPEGAVVTALLPGWMGKIHDPGSGPAGLTKANDAQEGVDEAPDVQGGN